MLNHTESLAMQTSVLEALPGKLDIKRHPPSIYYRFTFLPKLFLLAKLCSVLQGTIFFILFIFEV